MSLETFKKRSAFPSLFIISLRKLRFPLKASKNRQRGCEKEWEVFKKAFKKDCSLVKMNFKGTPTMFLQDNRIGPLKKDCKRLHFRLNLTAS